MKKITDKYKARAIEILIKSLGDIPGTLRIIKKDHQFERRLREFCTFCINIAILKDGAYITGDEKGVALIFNGQKKVATIPFLTAYLRLGSKCIGWDRVIPILWKQRIINSKKPKMEYLHFWILAVEDNSFGLRTIIEIRDFTYAMSAKSGLPLFAETRIDRNRVLYERYGFKCYDTWKPKSEENQISFLLRQPPAN